MAPTGTEKKLYFPIKLEEIPPISTSLSISFLAILLVQLYLVSRDRWSSHDAILSSSGGIRTILFLSWIFLFCFFICLWLLKTVSPAVKRIINCAISIVSIILFILLILPGLSRIYDNLSSFLNETVGSFLLYSSFVSSDFSSLSGSLASFCGICTFVVTMYIHFEKKGVWFASLIIIVFIAVLMLPLAAIAFLPIDSAKPARDSKAPYSVSTHDEESFEMVQMVHAEASSRTTTQDDYGNKIDYNAMQVFNDDLPWMEDVTGNGTGEISGDKATPKQWVTVYFSEKVSIDALGFRLGYVDKYHPERYRENNRPQDCELTFSDGSTQRVHFSDENKMHIVRFANPIETQSVKITLISVYEGKYHQTCISKIEAYQIR